MRILVVDDKEEARYLLSALLTGHGHVVEEAPNGKEALDELRGDGFDMVISDILMPVMDGFQLCRELRKDERLKSTPFVFYTATYVEDSDATFAMQLGADDFILKPAEPDAFLARIQKVIDKASARGWVPSRPELTDEADVLRLYSERLVAKLEKRTIELDAELAQRRQVEDALRESEDRFRQLFNHMSSCVFVYRACSKGEDFLIVDFNEAGERTEAISREGVIGKRVQEVFPSIKPSGLLDVFQRVWRTGVSEHYPSAEHRDRRIHRWRENYVYKLPSNEIVAIYDDITAQKQAEERIRWLSSLPDEDPNPVLRIANDGTLLYANKAGETLMREGGCEVGVVIPSPCHDLVQQALEEGRKNAEIELGGRVFLLTLNPIAGEEYVNVYSADITKMKEAEAALRKQEEEYRLLVENASEAIFIGQDGYIRFPNSATMSLLGRTAKEIGSHPFVEFIHPEDRRTVDERHKRRLAGEEVETGYEFRFVTANGAVRWARLNATRVEWQGRPATLNLISDVTERKEAEERVQRVLGETIHAVGTITERRDPYTSGHQERVAALACAIACEMGLAEDRTAGLRVASLLHDIGKLAVPAEILSKPATLTATEFALVKQHPQIAHDILKEIEFPWPVAEIILQHHERLNGSGYPNGMRDSDIRLEAEILAVADVVEAMASHRPYRPARGIDEALKEIEAGKDRLYNPTAVDACVRVFTERGFRFES